MILLRHAQSEFNLHFSVTRRDPGIIDPPLTPAGHQQAADLAHALADAGIERIITSPYTRALQTVAPIARRLGIPVLINPIVRERYAFTCDVGTPRDRLERDWPHLDFSEVDEVWWPAVEEPVAGIDRRARLFRAEMAATQGWEQTLVVSHWGFIRALTGETVTNGQWMRCDPTQTHPVS